MKWNKLGFSFDVSKYKNSWQISHAMMPVVLEKEECLRVFYTTRHIDGRSRICYYDVDKFNPTNIIYVHDQPVLEVGEVGSFDDCGTVGTFVLEKDEVIYLYYNGYNVRNTVPWSNSIGLAVSYDGGNTFKKMFEGPIMDRLKNDSFFTITPCIIVEDEIWHMWYTSGTGWLKINDKQEPVYDIKYASSRNGIDWDREFLTAISQNDREECIARASIIKNRDKLFMWFIYRGSRDFRDGKDSYRIGFAEGNINNPTKWDRKDELAGIIPGPEGYDNLMQAYPFVIQVKDKTLMFYNGNGFGSEGILVAELNK